MNTTTPLFLLVALASACALPVRAEKDRSSLDLLAPDAWTELGEWTTAGNVVGSTSEKKWKKIEPGSGIFYNGAEGKTTNPFSKESFGDAEIEAEFMIPKSSNSGIYVMQRYEVQILDSFGKADDQLSNHDCGGIYQRWDESKPEKERGYEGTAPSTNASTAPGSWQKFRIRFRAPRFDENGNKTQNARFLLVEHNGVVIHQDIEVTGPTRGGKDGPEVASAPIKIQGDHGPVAFRKFVVKPLQLD